MAAPAHAIRAASDKPAAPGWGVEREQDMDYQGVFMITPDGESFDIDIPAFSLDGPETKRTLN